MWPFISSDVKSEGPRTLPVREQWRTTATVNGKMISPPSKASSTIAHAGSAEVASDVISSSTSRSTSACGANGLCRVALAASCPRIISSGMGIDGTSIGGAVSFFGLSGLAISFSAMGPLCLLQMELISYVAYDIIIS